MNITAKVLAELFIEAPIPKSVCPDGINGDPTRTGTNLLTYSEAQEIFEWMLRELGKPTGINLPDDLKDQEDLNSRLLENCFKLESDIRELKGNIAYILCIDHAAPDLDGLPNVRSMSRTELAKYYREASRKISVYKTRERKLKSLITPNIPIERDSVADNKKEKL